MANQTLMNRDLRIAAGLLLLGIGFAAGVMWGWRRGQFQAGLEENKIAAVNLQDNHLNISPDLREYLKGRIYYNIATKFPNDRGYLLRGDWDFGPVDLSKWSRQIYVKDTWECSSFDSATGDLSEAEPDTLSARSPASLPPTDPTPLPEGSTR